jgi:hypothetical protein
MNDPEFISLLNLYVDREISPEDALRLEGEVLKHPKRRAIYDQYCRMQKACTMLSGEVVEKSLARRPAAVLPFPGRSWGFGPVAAGLAAAAVCAVGIVGFKLYRADRNAVLQSAPAAVIAAAPAAPAESAAMKPVVVLRLPDAGAAHPLFASDHAGAIADLNWIGDIHMPPVFTAATPDLLNPKADPKAAALAEPPSVTAPAEPAEMTAFRFQR